jgi:hypothetical protein
MPAKVGDAHAEEGKGGVCAGTVGKVLTGLALLLVGGAAGAAVACVSAHEKAASLAFVNCFRAAQ